MTRREFGKTAALAVAAAGTGLGTALSPTRAGAEEQLVTDIEANAPIVTSLGYVNESPKPDQLCAGCVLYNGPAEGRGKCSVFPQGVVSAKGWCRSWAPRPS